MNLIGSPFREGRAFLCPIGRMQAFFDTIQTLKVLSDDAKMALQQIITLRKESKGHYLVREGKPCNDLFFLTKGCLRGCYTNADGKDMTTWFAFENTFVTSFYSFIARKPATENIVLLEDCQLLALPHDGLQSLYDQFHEIERLGRLVNEQYYLRLEERMVNSHFKSASERYEALMNENPQMLLRVPLGCIATYLGITQETLSRIRSKS